MTPQEMYDDYLHLREMNSNRASKIKLLQLIVAQGTNNWRVVGITPKALNQLQNQEYKYQTGSGIQRAHVYRRHDTYSKLIDDLKGQDEFWKLIDERDQTILAAKGETKDITFDKAILFEDPPELFIKPNQRIYFPARSVGYRHSVLEREFLKEFHAKYKSKVGQC